MLHGNPCHKLVLSWASPWQGLWKQFKAIFISETRLQSWAQPARWHCMDLVQTSWYIWDRHHDKINSFYHKYTQQDTLRESLTDLRSIFDNNLRLSDKIYYIFFRKPKFKLLATYHPDILIWNVFSQQELNGVIIKIRCKLDTFLF